MHMIYLFCVCACVAAYSIQGQNVQIISPSSESHQQVVAVGQPLSAQPQGTVVVRQKKKKAKFLYSFLFHFCWSIKYRGLIFRDVYPSYIYQNWQIFSLF